MRHIIDRKNLYVPKGRPGYDEMVALAEDGFLAPQNWAMDEGGIHVNIWDYWDRKLMRGRKKKETAEEARERFGISQEQWDQIPDLPQDQDYWHGIRAPRNIEKGR